MTRAAALWAALGAVVSLGGARAQVHTGHPVVHLRDAAAQPDFSRLPRFFTSDAAYDAFANEWFMRHLSVDGRGIYLGGGPVVGATDHMWVVEWDAWMFPWIDRGAMGLARQGGDPTDVPLTTLATAAIDRFGYVYGARPEPEPRDSLGGYKPTFGWPWPKYNRNTLVARPTGWEFNDPRDGARAEWAAEGVALEPGYVDHGLRGTVTAAQPAFVSPAFEVDAYHVPIVELDITYTAPAGAHRHVAALRLYWATTEEPEFIEERSVGVEFAALPPTHYAEDFAPWVGETTARYALHFPMLLHPAWGRGGQRITRLKLVAAGSDAAGVRVDLNYLRATYDVRMTTTNAALIHGVYRFTMWSGDVDYLRRMLPRVRRAITFLNEHLRGRRDGLLCLDWLAGHDGLGGEVGHGMIGSYWDLLPSGRYDLESSAAYYQALLAMAALEEAARRHGVHAPGVSVVGPDGRTALRYRETPASLRRMAARTRRAVERRFWVPGTGRFCRNIDAAGRQHDFGFVHANLHALACGLGTAAQRASVLAWLDGERRVAGDTAVGADIYRWRFAPRTSTRRNETWYYWAWPWERERDPGNPQFAWGNQMQDGGAIPLTSLLEALVRCSTGAQQQVDRAFERTRQVGEWYQEVRAAGGQGRDFYRAYYAGRPERGLQQGGGPAGGLGLDREFLSDASLGTTWIPLAFLGLDAPADGVLAVAPAIPSGLEVVGVENVWYRGAHLRIEAGRCGVSLAGSRIPRSLNARLRLTLRGVPDGAIVTVDGKRARWRRDGGGSAVVETLLRPVVVEVVHGRDAAR